MTPSFLNDMSWRMAEVYGAVSDRLLINLAKYFKYADGQTDIMPSFEYQARMLGKMGLVTKESVDIIMQSLGGADRALRTQLEAAILNALRNEEPKLKQAAQLGLLGAVPPGYVPEMSRAFQTYYRQSADKLNLVNTVMLESTQAAYQATVSDIAARIDRTQGILNTATGEVVTGVTAYNAAMRDAVKKMVANGLTGFIDHGGHRWSPEAYVAMDIRTTMFNTARAAVWERSEQYGNDLYQVSSHNGARPLCYPWQGKVISRSDTVRDVTDLDGNTVHVYAQSETSYGQAAGLFGVQCGHYPMSFIPGFSTLKGEPQDPEENEKTYAESQEQRALERKLREERRDLAVMKAQGASTDEIKAQEARIKQASADIDEFCERTGRARKRNREYTPVNASFPNKDSYDTTQFPTNTRDQISEWAKGDRGVPLQNVASKATKSALDVVQSEAAQTITRAETEQKTKTVYALSDATKTQGLFIANPASQSEIILKKADIYTMPDGVQFVFKSDMDKSKQRLTPEDVISRYYQMPLELRQKAQKTFCVVDRYNPYDSYWKKTYKNFTQSFATGGDMITFYRYDQEYDIDYIFETFGHEMGHGLDKANAIGYNWFSELTEWGEAMAQDEKFSKGVAKSVSTYGLNSPKEDFAESVKKFVSSQAVFTAAFPNRAKIINRLLYGGDGT